MTAHADHTTTGKSVMHTFHASGPADAVDYLFREMIYRGRPMIVRDKWSTYRVYETPLCVTGRN